MLRLQSALENCSREESQSFQEAQRATKLKISWGEKNSKVLALTRETTLLHLNKAQPLFAPPFYLDTKLLNWLHRRKNLVFNPDKNLFFEFCHHSAHMVVTKP